jgi:hypothetical protein
MMKLTPRDRDREPRDVLPFPSEALRRLHAGRVPTDREACDAARRVELAMADVQRRFSRLRLMIERGDDDRPRAA